MYFRIEVRDLAALQSDQRPGEGWTLVAHCRSKLSAIRTYRAWQVRLYHGSWHSGHVRCLDSAGTSYRPERNDQGKWILQPEL